MEVYWLEQSERDVPPGERWLSRAEREVLRGYRIPKRRADWRLGRWTAKLAIATYQGLPREPEALAAIEMRAASSGAPRAFLEGRPASMRLSLSHSHGVGFCAIASDGAQLGCDIESVEPRSPAFLEDYFTAGEQQAVRAQSGPQRDRMATLLWSAKESALKALECGLRCDTRAIAARLVSQTGSGWHPLQARHVAGPAFFGWWREARGLVWTLLATPPPQRPTALGFMR